MITWLRSACALLPVADSSVRNEARGATRWRLHGSTREVTRRVTNSAGDTGRLGRAGQPQFAPFTAGVSVLGRQPFKPLTRLRSTKPPRRPRRATTRTGAQGSAAVSPCPEHHPRRPPHCCPPRHTPNPRREISEGEQTWKFVSRQLACRCATIEESSAGESANGQTTCHSDVPFLNIEDERRTLKDWPRRLPASREM